MTTNIDRAAELLWLPEPHLSGSECDDQARELAQALADDGLLMPDPQVIRTVAELEALDPETVVWPARHYGPYTVGTIVLDPFNTEWTPPLPAVVVATGPQVRAARKAMEEA